MAVYVVVRLVIAVGAGYRVVKAEQAASGQPGFETAARYFWDRLHMETEADLELAEEMQEYLGRVVEVTTFNDPFELRKVQFIWSIQDAAVASEDARVCTFHLLKAPGGTPSSDWLAGDFTAMDSAFTTWWGSLKTWYTPETTWDRIKVYKDGPAIVPPQVPVYDADKSVPGTQATDPLPPQVAVSVTEIAGSKRYWGRFYLPAPYQGSAGTYGRIIAGLSTAVADATDVLYTALRTATLEPVVYRAQLPERETRAGATLPARSASAWTVEKIQVDDVFDVIRRRRYKYPTLRTQRDI